MIGLCTAANEAAAKVLIDGMLDTRLAACVTLVPGVQSYYWWQEKRDSASEVLLIIKTRADRVEALKHFVQEHHEYDVPELIFLSVSDGLEAYMAWIQKETRHAAGSD